MNDDPRLPDDELASAYLDGHVSEVERARVEASPELGAIVSALASVRHALADVPSPPDATRDAALAAALAEFDRLHLGTTAPAVATPPAARAPVLSFVRRRWVKPVFAAAAAVLLAGVITVSVLSNRGSDEKSSSNSPAELATGDAGTQMSSGGSPSSTIGSIAGPAVAPVQIDDRDELLALAEQYVPLARDTAGGTDSTMAAASETTMPGAESTAPAATAEATADDGKRTANGCPLGEHQVVVADIIWVDTPAVAVRDTVTGEVQAIDAQCNVLVTITP